MAEAFSYCGRVILSTLLYSPGRTIKRFPLRSEFLIIKLSAVMNAAHVSQPVNQPGKPEKQRSDYGCRLAACLGNNFMKTTLDLSKLLRVQPDSGS